jgi:3-phosphoshikimate 1-carboxyvinyltransferase
MTVTVHPSAITGTLAAPASKSQTIRAIAAAMLAKGVSIIRHPSRCDDALAMMEIARQLGREINYQNDVLEIKGSLQPTFFDFDCGESGLAARLMIALAPALFEIPVTISGKGTLLKRSLGNLCEVLQQLGVHCHSANGKLPYHLTGKMKAGEVVVDGSESSQFVSGLLMALPLLDGESKLIVRNLKSAPYVLMTLEAIAKFGIEIKQPIPETYIIGGSQNYHPAETTIEGDWSGAAFLLVAAALAGDLTITGLDLQSVQADWKVLDALAAAGIPIEISDSGIAIRQQRPKPFIFDCTHCPDLFPPLAVLAAAAKGTSTLSGVHRLQNKESNRGLVLQKELGKMSAQIEIVGDEMHIHGGAFTGATIDAHNDHRIAMAATVAALVATAPVTISGSGCVSKSWPTFFDDLRSLGARIKTKGE